MERPCYQCGAAVEESTAFCPQCHAPQIRVAPSTPEPQLSSFDVSDEQSLNASASPPLEPGTPGQAQPPAEPAPISSPPTSSPAGLDWSQAVPVSAMAGAIVAVTSAMVAIPFLGLIVWMGGTGIVAVLLYRRRTPQAIPSPGMGAKIGALAGAFGFGVFALLLAVQMLLTRNSGRFRATLEQVIQQAAAQNSDPRAQEIIQRLSSPEGLALILTLVLVMSLVAFLLFSSLGGALAAHLMRGKRER
jgi:hypothetical protein